MAKEYSRSERVADHLKRELAALLQFEVRDPRVGLASITSIEVSRDLAHARVFCTVLGKDSAEEAAEPLQALNKAAGFLRTRLSKDSTMRTVPQLRFMFDSSVVHGAYMDALIQRAVAADSDSHGHDNSQPDTEQE